MALKLGSLFYDIGADTSNLKRAEDEVTKTTNKMGHSFNKLKGLIVGALSFQAIKSTVMLADKMNMLDQKIKNVSNSAKQFQTIRQGVRDIAKETGGSIESISTLSQQLLIAGESVGATDEQIVQMTSNLNKLGSIGGSSGEQMGNSMLQFGQAMAGGIVRAEEFNSIVENTPVIAKSIATGMGLSVGELRKAVIEGRVLSQDVFNSLGKQTDGINSKFAAMPLTVDRASGMIANSFAVAVQEIDQGLGVTETIAETMKYISEIIASDLVPFVDEVYLNFKEISILLDSVTGSLEDSNIETSRWGENIEAVKKTIGFIWTSIKQLPVNLSGLFTVLIGEIDQLFMKSKASVKQFTLFFWNGMNSAIASVKSSFFKFIGGMQSKLASVFEFFGGDDIADSLQQTANSTFEIADKITKNEEEQALIRSDIIDAEIAKINEKLEVQLVASQMAIEIGLNETEEIKKQTAKRIENIRKEMKAKRDASKVEVKTVEEKKDIIQKNYKEEQQALSAHSQASSILRSAGLIDAKSDAVIQAGISAAMAISKSSEVGYPQALPFVAQAFANFANVKRVLSGSGRANGGTATGGLPIPVNEHGSPEMFINNAGRQFLLPDQSGKIIPLNAGGNTSASNGLNLVINNNSNAVVSEPVVTQGEMMIEINNAVERAVEQVNTSLATQRGSTSDALNQGFTQTRNI